MCDFCPLAGSRVVPPEGPESAAFVIVGESPGKQEDERRQPFVGPSGKLLNEILWKAGLRREAVWITNTILCRPKVPGVTGKKQFDMKAYMAWVRKENVARQKKAKEEAKLRAERIRAAKRAALGLAPDAKVSLTAEEREQAKVAWENVSSPIECCAPRLRHELLRAEDAAKAAGWPNGAVVLPTGNFALKATTGKDGVMKRRGSPVLVTVNEDGSFTPRWDPRPDHVCETYPPPDFGKKI
jgi:DNA polymerase